MSRRLSIFLFVCLTADHFYIDRDDRDDRELTKYIFFINRDVY